MTFEEAAKLTRSEKITFVVMKAESRVKLFDPYLVDSTHDIYVRDVDYFVDSVKEAGFTLLKVDSIANVVAESFYYDVLNKKLYAWFSGGRTAAQTDVSIVYRFHFSTAPMIMPHDLDSGDHIEWLPYVESIGSIGQQLDDQNTGIVLESSSSVSFLNNEAFFDEIFDRFIWENKEAEFYYWFAGTPITEARLIFKGVVAGKDFSPVTVTFKIKDFIFKLKDVVSLRKFSDADGYLQDRYLGKAKRRIYGRCDKVQAIGIDCTLDGYTLTGTFTVTSGSASITGTGSNLLNECYSGDSIVFEISGEEVEFNVDTVTNSGLLTITDSAEVNASGLIGKIRPKTPSNLKNRRWHLADHPLTTSEMEITYVINAGHFLVDNHEEFLVGDKVTLNGVTTTITNVALGHVIIGQLIFPSPVAGDIIYKEPVLNVYYNGKRLLQNRDFTVNTTSETIIEIDELAEFNIAKESLSKSGGNGFTLTFTAGSRIITTSATVDLKTVCKPRDWIRSVSQSVDTWYQISSVYETVIILRTNYTESDNTDIARIRSVDVIQDDSVICVDCYGIQADGKWVKTASDIVKHLLTNDAGFDNIDTVGFDQANSDCSFIMSMVVPEVAGDAAPTIRDVITLINESVIGSLYGNSSQDISFSIMNTRRPIDISPIKDDDVMSWSSNSENNIINQVAVSYRQQTSLTDAENYFIKYTYDSSFVNKYIGISNAKEAVSYVYNESDAINIAQRIAFYNSLPAMSVSIISKSIFFNYFINDRIYVELDRLYARYGSITKKKIGIVSSIKKNSYDTEIVLNDMGNIFNRNPVISESTQVAFSSATDDDKVKYGFILDTEKLTPDTTSEDELGNCLIG